MFCSKPQRSPKVINKKHIYTSTYFYHNVEIKCHHASYPVLDISPTLPFLNISWICIEHYNLLVCFRPHKKMYENYLCLFQLKVNKCKLSFVYFNHLEILFSAVYVGLVPVQHHLLPMFRPIGHVPCASPYPGILGILEDLWRKGGREEGMVGRICLSIFAGPHPKSQQCRNPDPYPLRNTQSACQTGHRLDFFHYQCHPQRFGSTVGWEPRKLMLDVRSCCLILWTIADFKPFYTRTDDIVKQWHESINQS